MARSSGRTSFSTISRVRSVLVDRILVGGWPAAHAAESMGVSRQTAYRWLRRWREEGEQGLLDRSSRPHRSPNRVSSVIPWQATVCRDRGEVSHTRTVPVCGYGP